MELNRKRLCAPVRNSSLSNHIISHRISHSPPQDLLVVDETYKLNVIYPSRSLSNLLKTSVILFKEIQACTKRSKDKTFSRTFSSPRPLEWDFAYVENKRLTNCGERRYPKATRESSNSRREMLPEWSVSKRSKRVRQAERKPQSLLIIQ